MQELKSKPPAPTPEQTGVPNKPLDFGTQVRWEKSPRKLIDFLKTLGWVAPLTVLIWIYAEREQSATREQVTVPIEVRLQEPNRVVRLTDAPDSDNNLILTLAGPRTNLDRVIRDITTISTDHQRIQLLVPAKKPRGNQGLSALDLVAANPIFTANGISVKGVAPQQITVFIDDLEEKELPIQGPAGMSNIVEDPSFSPSLVKVRAPQSAFEEAAKTGKLRLVADLSRVDAFRTPGHHDVASVPLTWEFQGPNVVLSTLAVRAAFDVKLAEQEFTIPSLSVFIVIPSVVQDRFDVKFPTTIANVKVAGPADVIAKLRDDTVPAGARLYVDPGKLIPGRELQGTLKFDHPDGVHFVDDASKLVTYQLTEKTGTQ